MASEEPSPTISKRVLNKDDLDKLPNDIRTKYEEFFSEYLQIKALYETQKTQNGKFLV